MASIAANHCDMAKFERPSSQFLVLAEALKRYSNDAQNAVQQKAGLVVVKGREGNFLLPSGRVSKWDVVQAILKPFR